MILSAVLVSPTLPGKSSGLLFSASPPKRSPMSVSSLMSRQRADSRAHSVWYTPSPVLNIPAGYLPCALIVGAGPKVAYALFPMRPSPHDATSIGPAYDCARFGSTAFQFRALSHGMLSLDGEDKFKSLD